MPRWGMVIDLRRCNGCGGCAVNCGEFNRASGAGRWRRIVQAAVEAPSGTLRRFIPLACMHCAQPPCADVCPTRATYRRLDGIVDIDSARCVGCGYCVVACPYLARTVLTARDRAPHLVWSESTGDQCHDDPVGTCVKCNMCAPRIDQGVARGLTPGVDRDATPVCVNTCVLGAISFGDLADPESAVSAALREHHTVRVNEELGTEPSIYYIVE